MAWQGSIAGAPTGTPAVAPTRNLTAWQGSVAAAPTGQPLYRTTSLATGRTTGDESCDPSTCQYRQLGFGNTFHCSLHIGAVHVCDQRCRFREALVDAAGQCCYRCRISGMVTHKRYLPASKSSSKRSLDDSTAGVNGLNDMSNEMDLGDGGDFLRQARRRAGPV